MHEAVAGVPEALRLQEAPEPQLQLREVHRTGHLRPGVGGQCYATSPLLVQDKPIFSDCVVGMGDANDTAYLEQGGGTTRKHPHVTPSGAASSEALVRTSPPSHFLTRQKFAECNSQQVAKHKPIVRLMHSRWRGSPRAHLRRPHERLRVGAGEVGHALGQAVPREGQAGQGGAQGGGETTRPPGWVVGWGSRWGRRAASTTRWCARHLADTQCQNWPKCAAEIGTSS